MMNPYRVPRKLKFIASENVDKEEWEKWQRIVKAQNKAYEPNLL